jgi:HK97 family phage major capsid protein
MNPELKRLIEARQKAWSAMREISDRIAAENDGEGREWTAEEDAAWKRGNADLDAMDERIRSIVDLETRQAGIDSMLEQYGAPAPAGAPAAVNPDVVALRALAAGEARSAEFLPTPHEQRVLSGLSAGAGLNTVPTSFYDTLIEAMKETSTVLAANAMLLETASGEPMQIPTAASGSYPTAALVAEAGTIGASDPAFGQTTINAYKYAFLTQVSSELLSDTAIDLIGFLGRRGGEALGNGTGAAFVVGTGSSQPTGIAGSAGFASVASLTGSAAAGFVYNDVLALVHGITRPYRANASFICNDSVTLTLRKLRDGSGGAGTGQYLWQPSMQAGVPDTLAGYPVFTDPAMVATTTNGHKGLAFGDWNKGLAVRIAGGVRVERSSDFAFSTDLDTWRFIVRADSRIVDAAAARVLTYTT